MGSSLFKKGSIANRFRNRFDEPPKPPSSSTMDAKHEKLSQSAAAMTPIGGIHSPAYDARHTATADRDYRRAADKENFHVNYTDTAAPRNHLPDPVSAQLHNIDEYVNKTMTCINSPHRIPASTSGMSIYDHLRKDTGATAVPLQPLLLPPGAGGAAPRNLEGAFDVRNDF